MTARNFLKTLCLVPIGAFVEKLPGQGVAQTAETMDREARAKAIEANTAFIKRELERQQWHQSHDGIRSIIVRKSTFNDWGNSSIQP